MRPHIALAAAATLLLAAAPAHAEIATPSLRIEGRTATLFEGSLRADGHAVRAAGDTRDRPCDGTNGGRATTPGPTPTSLAADGLRLAGTDFGGSWFAGFDDYLISRFGPDAEGVDGAWSLVIDGRMTTRGGCQLTVPTGSEALWAFAASADQPYLRLTGPTTAAPNTPLAVTVRDAAGGVAGASVVPVQTAANGFQTPVDAGPTTGADGVATLTFAAPGWHRVKAVKAGAIRSNRLDVCVGECGPPPADALVRDVVPAPPAPSPTPTPQPGPQIEPPPPFSTPTLTRSGSRLRLRSVDPRLTSWTVTATPLGVKRAKPLTRTGTTFRVPTGREYAFAFNGASLGTLIVPIDDRARAIRYGGRTTRKAAYTRLAKGATATVRLGAGRPLLLLAKGSRGKVEVAGRRYTAKPGTLRARSRGKTGIVRIKVRSGALNLQGVAAGG